MQSSSSQQSPSYFRVSFPPVVSPTQAHKQPVTSSYDQASRRDDKDRTHTPSKLLSRLDSAGKRRPPNTTFAGTLESCAEFRKTHDAALSKLEYKQQLEDSTIPSQAMVSWSHAMAAKFKKDRCVFHGVVFRPVVLLIFLYGASFLLSSLVCSVCFLPLMHMSI